MDPSERLRNQPKVPSPRSPQDNRHLRTHVTTDRRTDHMHLDLGLTSTGPDNSITMHMHQIPQSSKGSTDMQGQQSKQIQGEPTKAWWESPESDSEQISMTSQASLSAAGSLRHSRRVLCRIRGSWRVSKRYRLMS